MIFARRGTSSDAGASSSCLYLTTGPVSSQDCGLLGGARRVVYTARRGTSSHPNGMLVVPLSNRLAL